MLKQENNRSNEKGLYSDHPETVKPHAIHYFCSKRAQLATSAA